ncbi:MAG: nucleoside triphosphate pyrophosphohydrolase [Pseudobdellovibrio sp.]|nr:nucleoside triphosphate pyrophosphohydrolase [Pseudobdellovibrio sp.]
MPIPPKNLNEFSSLLQLMRDLRGPDGCPWDKEQTHLSLAPYAIEETFEMVEALEKQDDAEFCEELGDVLFQVVLHAQLATERKAFDINDVIKTIGEKLVRRHPHVFSEVQVSGSEEVIKNWNEIKAKEKAGKVKPVFSLPKGLPALPTAEKIGSKTEKLKFDWNDPRQVLAQLKSEIAELEVEMNRAEIDNGSLDHEMGDVLFSAAQLARHLKIDAESSLRRTNLRFQKRFNAMLADCDNSVEKFTALAPEQKEELWKKAKKGF